MGSTFEQLNQFFPGPGHYDRIYDSKYNDIYKQSFHSEMKDLVPSSNFASTTKRQLMSFNNTAPGPGTYNIKQKWGQDTNKQNKFQPPKQQEIVEETTEKDNYIMNAVFYDIQHYQKHIDQDIGPGDYNPNHNAVKKRTGAAVFPRESIKQEKNFKQDTLIDNQDKLQYLQLIQKHNPEQDINQIKKEWILRKKALARQQEKKIIQVEKFAVPDPGYYYDQEKDTQFQPYKKKQTSAFNVNQQRFQHKVLITPDPYEVVDLRKVGFAMNTKKRFDEGKEDDKVPPGQYEDVLNLEYKLEQQLKDQLNKKSAAIFGSSLKRFSKLTCTDNLNPGPGAYIKEKARKKNRVKVQKVNLRNDLQNNDYADQEIQKIEINLTDKIKQAVHKQYQQQKTKKAGFCSNEQRFKGKILTEEKKIEFQNDIGKYNTLTRLDRQTYRKTTSNFAKVNIQIQNQRFLSFTNATDEELGPGYYDLPVKYK